MVIGGGHCNRLQSKVTVNRDFVEAVALLATVNRLMEMDVLSCPTPLTRLIEAAIVQRLPA
jgi:hypothetical protein